MPDKIKHFQKHKKSDNIPISEALELSDLHRRVGENTSEIEKLKEQTSKMDELKMEVIEIKTNSRVIEQKLDQLNKNDSSIGLDIKSISDGTVKFRYWLGGAVVVIFSCIFGTLMFGLSATNDSQSNLQTHLEKRIEDSDKKHENNYNRISDQINGISEFLMESKKPE